MRCPDCGQDQPDGDRFCEDCGARLTAVPPSAAGCRECAGAIGADGFCGQCGVEHAPANGHVEMVNSATLAGVSDRGRRYDHNEDAFALATTDDGDIVVVCDGVSCSQMPAAASHAAAGCVRDSLLAALKIGVTDDTAAVATALTAAHEAVAGLPFQENTAEHPPETTVVAALRRGRRVAVGWLGDSRAYHVTPDTARPLTTDHSWLQEEVAAGRLTHDEAMRSRNAHAITRTLGGPDGPDPPEVRAFDLPPGPSLLLLCTDGLWAAFPDPAGLSRTAWQLAARGDALAVARGLVDAANERHGRDNATAAVLILDTDTTAVDRFVSHTSILERRP